MDQEIFDKASKIQEDMARLKAEIHHLEIAQQVVTSDTPMNLTVNFDLRIQQIGISTPFGTIYMNDYIDHSLCIDMALRHKRKTLRDLEKRFKEL